MQVLNFYSTIFADQLKRGRKTATIRLGDKSHKYRKNQAVLVTIGYQHSPREKIFEAVIDQVEVKRVKDLSPRDIEHDNPEFRRHEEMIHFLEQIYGKKVSVDDIVTVVRFSQIIENPPEVHRTGCTASAARRTSAASDDLVAARSTVPWLQITTGCRSAGRRRRASRRGCARWRSRSSCCVAELPVSVPACALNQVAAQAPLGPARDGVERDLRSRTAPATRRWNCRVGASSSTQRLQRLSVT